ncbi:ribosome maturation factor RimM [Denitratisoma oestradiolicum]|uniref:Ribosome maturation factor RimM n=1 Tax=Denitratisoma oestradiolicum TaxID=311182 RepID=A0A6S6XUI1_9PROT|nr:ribosome maturation factor RimM [Denitratisoma oestradiolicum]TWO79932.1 16S rRNA processing protein RimM [Denitratisoma oestradiolicum]CAB1369690.1 Ribosome maturation factor RimM [Denitratisoma oestradiolicum]
MIVLGRIVAPFGVQGWVHLHPFGDDPASWRRMSRWWLGSDPEGDDWRPLDLLGLKPHGDGWVAGFYGIADRVGAESLKGLYLGAPREDLPRPDEGEYYWADLIGLAVVNEQGETLGRVDSLIETGANDVLVVMDGEQKRLLPFIDQVVKSVDAAAGCIHVDWGSDW